MNTFSKALAEAHTADLRREATTGRDRAAARAALREASTPHAVTLRLSAHADAAALIRLAALDSSEVPATPVLIAEADGELLAALSLRDGAVIADPFRPTAELVQLLRKRAAQVRNDRSSWLRRLSTAGRGGRYRGAGLAPQAR